MASCPNCPATPLSAALINHELPVLSCRTCSGLLISLVSYRAWREINRGKRGEPEFNDPVTESEPDAAQETKDTVSACLCPKCKAVMSKYRFQIDSLNRLDYCAHCEEVWFDQGEWALVENLSLGRELTQIFTAPWQYTLRSQQAEVDSNSRWRERFGDDFQRINEFRTWLRRHKRASNILAYLNEPT